MRSFTLSFMMACLAAALPVAAPAKVISGSNGSDGALNPTSNLVIDMADHPDGIYHYTSVNIPAGVTVSFIPNAGNKPVVWLVQGDCTIAGNIDADGKLGSLESPGAGGPGGYRGGNGGGNASSGQGPGAGSPGTYGGNASFGSAASHNDAGVPPGSTYGNSFLLPLIGGSGGGGGTSSSANASGGGGAIMIAASGSVTISGGIEAVAADAYISYNPNGANFVGGGGSGGAIRIVATRVNGAGNILAFGGRGGSFHTLMRGGNGRIRFDVMESNFSGSINGVFTQGFQPIIIPAPGQGIQLTVHSLAGVAVSASPSGVLVNPDVIIPAQQANPIPVVVRCTNIPLNSEISVVVHPANGPDVQAVGLNNAGTTASSTATISLNMPRGGGIIYAKAVTGIAGGTASTDTGAQNRSLAETGWTADGERFKAMEITAALGGPQRIAYITESGKRHEAN